MIYLDTSVVVSALVPDAYTDVVRRWLERQDGPLAISRWVKAEFSSACAKNVRLGAMSRDAQNAARDAFSNLIEGEVDVLSVPEIAFVIASVMADRSDLGLRAPDALHLALARVNRIPIATNDRRLAATAPGFGVTALDLSVP